MPCSCKGDISKLFNKINNVFTESLLNLLQLRRKCNQLTLSFGYKILLSLNKKWQEFYFDLEKILDPVWEWLDPDPILREKPDTDLITLSGFKYQIQSSFFINICLLAENRQIKKNDSAKALNSLWNVYPYNFFNIIE